MDAHRSRGLDPRYAFEPGNIRGRLESGDALATRSELSQHRRITLARASSRLAASQPRALEQRASAIGEAAGKYIVEIFDSDDVLCQLRVVQAIVKYLETFPPTRANAACQRASFYGNYSYRGIKNILTHALDLEALPHAAIPEREGGRFRFARNISELITAEENGHEPN